MKQTLEGGNIHKNKYRSLNNTRFQSNANVLVHVQTRFMPALYLKCDMEKKNAYEIFR